MDIATRIEKLERERDRLEIIGDYRAAHLIHFKIAELSEYVPEEGLSR